MSRQNGRMAMGLNIKNAEAERLIKELAELTGQSKTAAVTDAVRKEIKTLRKGKRRKGALADELMRIGKECAAAMAKGPGKMMKIEDLYDNKTGLPK
jgi:antitoxin VapB